jgi:A/G-specific adenine glycosylase
MINKLIQWSNSEFNYLPWRKNRSLYGTLVSEIMLQQTTVSTVINHFEKFLVEYPTMKDVAEATDEQLTISWKGLGFYRRARNLKKACETISNEYAGVIPLDYEKLVAIPGIGDYTANAILAIGNNEPALALDANLERVIARLFEIKTIKGPKLLKEIRSQFKDNKIAQDVYKVGGRDYNEALMDLGRNYCQARRVTCELCPINSMCKSYKNKTVESIPNVEVKVKEKFVITLLRVLFKKENEYLVYRKSDNEWLSGQYEVPTFIISTNDKNLKQYPQVVGEFDYLPEFKTAITKYTITNKVLWCDESDLKKIGLSINDYELGNINLSTGSSKAINL